MLKNYLKKCIPLPVAGFVWKAYQDWSVTMGLEHSFVYQLVNTLLLSCVILSVVPIVFIYPKRNIIKLIAIIVILFLEAAIWYTAIPILKSTYNEEQSKRAILKEDKKETSIAKQKNIKPAPDSYEMIVRLENPEEFDISADAVVRMGIVPFSANNIMEGKVLWVKPKNEGGIKAKGSQLYNFGVLSDVSRVTFLVFTIQSEQIPDGFLYDIYYTWNGGTNWALLKDNLGNVDIEQVRRIQSFVNRIKQRQIGGQ